MKKSLKTNLGAMKSKFGFYYQSAKFYFAICAHFLMLQLVL